MKKSISFLMVALLILIGVARSENVAAQPEKNCGSNKYTVSHYGDDWTYVPLYLDNTGTPVEVWVDTWFHCVCHYIDLQQVWMNMRWRGSFTYNGVNYTIDDDATFGKNGGADWNDPVYYDCKFVSKVKGSDGSHLIASGIFHEYDENWNWVGTLVYDKIVSN